MALISESYKQLLAQEHQNTAWGHTAEQYVDDILDYARNHGFVDVLDYGAGRGGLALKLQEVSPGGLRVTEYEPSDPDRSQNNTPHDYVVCVDVLEHIEPECLENVLSDLFRVTQVLGYFTISTRPAGRLLPDGRNAHLIVENHEWWHHKVSQAGFEITQDFFDSSRQRGHFVVKT